MMLTKRIQNLKPSATFAIGAKAKALKAAGVTVVNLGVGEPDFATPDYIKRAGMQAIRDNFSHYTDEAGILELREALCRKLWQSNKLRYASAEVVVGVGSKQLLFLAMLALVERGDEVAIPVPTWTTYVEQVKLVEGRPVLMRMPAPFKLTAKRVEEKLTRKTKLLILNSPANPTGAMIDREELEKIARLVVKRKLWVVADEIYEEITYGSAHVSLAALGKAIKERVVTISGLSKAYAMTGWRVGYAAGPREAIKAIVALQGQTASNTAAVSQKAAEAALLGGRKEVQWMRAEFRRRRRFVVGALSQIRQFEVTPPEGAFYVFLGIKRLLVKKWRTSQEWCMGLLEKEGVAVVPGEAFLSPGYFRLSFAAERRELEEGVKRIKRFVEFHG